MHLFGSYTYIFRETDCKYLYYTNDTYKNYPLHILTKDF